VLPAIALRDTPDLTRLFSPADYASKEDIQLAFECFDREQTGSITHEVCAWAGHCGGATHDLLPCLWLNPGVCLSWAAAWAPRCPAVAD
jgi:hypothetical protein